MYVLAKGNTKDGWGLKSMQKRKTSEAQVQQDMSSSTRPHAQEAWVPVREPMTNAQANALRMLADELKLPNAFDIGLSKTEASRRIHRLQEQLRLGHLPPHTD